MIRIRKDVLQLTLPVVAEQMFIVSMGMVNTMLAGHIGEEAVSAIGMVDSINNIFISLLSSLALGGTVVVAQYMGQGKAEQANEGTKQALVSSVLISLVITLATWIFRNPLIDVLYGSAEKGVMADAIVYLGITLLTYPLIAITLVACGVLRGAGDTRTPMKVTILMNILNVLLSYTLIYGIDMGNDHFRIAIPGLGVLGAAIGIAAARVTGAILIMIVLLRGSKTIRLSGLRSFRFNTGLLRSIFNIGLPASVESLLFNVGKLITQVFIVGMGTASIAANYIAGSISSMINVPGGALGIAATTLVGQRMGRGDREDAKDSMIYIVKLSTICMTVLSLVILPLAKLMTSLYTDNSEVADLAAYVIRLSVLFMPVWSVAFVLPAALKGAGDAKFTMAVSVLCMWVFRITLGYVLGIPAGLGVAGVWLAMFIDWIVRGILYCIRLRYGKWWTHEVIDSRSEAC